MSEKIVVGFNSGDAVITDKDVYSLMATLYELYGSEVVKNGFTVEEVKEKLNGRHLMDYLSEFYLVGLKDFDKFSISLKNMPLEDSWEYFKKNSIGINHFRRLSVLRQSTEKSVGGRKGFMDMSIPTLVVMVHLALRDG